MENTGKKYVVITGASSGIGWEAARMFADRGRELVLVARRRQRLEDLRRTILEQHPRREVILREMDLSEPENLRELYTGLKGFDLEAWINNAGFGYYGDTAGQGMDRMEKMLRLDVEAVALLSVLFVRDYRDRPGTQLINVSSCGGYKLVPGAVTYCAAKFFVSAFTEGLARELIAGGSKLRAKVLAPAATRTEFGRVASGRTNYDYDSHFPKTHTGRQMAGFLLRLYDSDRVVGAVDRDTLKFTLEGPRFPSA